MYGHADRWTLLICIPLTRRFKEYTLEGIRCKVCMQLV